MTCIAGMIVGREAFVAADTLSTSGEEVFTDTFAKIVSRTILIEQGAHSYRYLPIVIGIAGDGHASQLIRYGDDLPPINLNENLDRWIATRLIPWMKSSVSEACVDSKRPEVEMMVSIRGRLFYVSTSWAFAEIKSYGATGSGRQFALGALYAEVLHSGCTPDPTKALTAAIRAAAHHMTNVGGESVETASTTSRDGS